MGCPDDNDLAEFLGGALAKPARRDLERHVEDCDQCRRLILLAGSAVPGGSPATAATVGLDVVAGAAELAPGEAIGRYRILERIGEGGMGVVYLARDPELRRRVALKMVRSAAGDPRSSGQGRLRLIREAQAMARLSHPNVVTVHDVQVSGRRRNQSTGRPTIGQKVMPSS